MRLSRCTLDIDAHSTTWKWGGVQHSEHLLGMAADIAIPGASLQRMYELALEVPQFAEGGIGVYDTNFLHVDVRERRARWARVHGSYVDVRAVGKGAAGARTSR